MYSPTKSTYNPSLKDKYFFVYDEETSKLDNRFIYIKDKKIKHLSYKHIKNLVPYNMNETFYTLVIIINKLFTIGNTIKELEKKIIQKVNELSDDQFIYVYYNNYFRNRSNFLSPKLKTNLDTIREYQIYQNIVEFEQKNIVFNQYYKVIHNYEKFDKLCENIVLSAFSKIEEYRINNNSNLSIHFQLIIYYIYILYLKEYYESVIYFWQIFIKPYWIKYNTEIHFYDFSANFYNLICKSTSLIVEKITNSLLANKTRIQKHQQILASYDKQKKKIGIIESIIKNLQKKTKLDEKDLKNLENLTKQYNEYVIKNNTLNQIIQDNNELFTGLEDDYFLTKKEITSKMLQELEIITKINKKIEINKHSNNDLLSYFASNIQISKLEYSRVRQSLNNYLDSNGDTVGHLKSYEDKQRLVCDKNLPEINTLNFNNFSDFKKIFENLIILNPYVKDIIQRKISEIKQYRDFETQKNTRLVLQEEELKMEKEQAKLDRKQKKRQRKKQKKKQKKKQAEEAAEEAAEAQAKEKQLKLNKQTIAAIKIQRATRKKIKQITIKRYKENITKKIEKLKNKERQKPVEKIIKKFEFIYHNQKFDVRNKDHLLDIFSIIEDVGFDLINILQEILKEFNIKCVITGGYAVAIHSEKNYKTTDIDIKLCPLPGFVPYQNAISDIRNIVYEILQYAGIYTTTSPPLLDFGTYRYGGNNNDGTIPIKIKIPKLVKNRSINLEFIDITFSSLLKNNDRPTIDELLCEENYRKKIKFYNFQDKIIEKNFYMMGKVNLKKNLTENLLPQLEDPKSKYKHKEESWREQLRNLSFY